MSTSARWFWQFDFRDRVQIWGVGFVLPTVLFFAVFKYGPMLWALELSFTSYDMVSAPRFVGLDNYRDLAADPIFRETLVNTLVYIGGSTVLITLVALGLALAINTRVPGARYCMMAMFLTNLMPIIAVCLVWRFLLHPDRKSTRLNSSHGYISYAAFCLQNKTARRRTPRSSGAI